MSSELSAARLEGALGALGDLDLDRVRALLEIDGEVASWSVVSCATRDRLDAPYEVELVLRTRDLGAAPGRLLGKSAVLTLARGTSEQRVAGLFRDIEVGSTDPRHLEIVATLVPALSMGALVTRSRVFQEKTVPEILAIALRDLLGPYERRANLDGLTRTYPKCEYRVQYRESDLAFVLRLMHEVGIFFRFDHDGEVEELQLLDHSSGYVEVSSARGGIVPLALFGGSDQGAKEVVKRFSLRSEVKSTAYRLRGFDWTRPGSPVEAERLPEPPPRGDDPDGAALGPEREVYDHAITSLGFDRYEGRPGAYRENDAASVATRRREAIAAGARVAKGVATVLEFAPGKTFELSGHPQVELDGRYVLLEVAHRFLREGAGAEEAHECTFVCQPADVPFRPEPPKERPRVLGPETAIVVGPPGSEIHTDEHGRVKVQLHWDRERHPDGRSSCFLRVMQTWAGEGWGFVFLPRVGMEVVVSFLEGDPDRPLVTGAVFNGANPTPYELPEQASRSTLRTRSTPQSDGYNELSFEDATGAEQIYLRAERDLDEDVRNDHHTHVIRHQSNLVDGIQTVTVGMERLVTVGLNETIQIGASRIETVVGPETIRLLSTRDTDVVASDQLTVHGTRDENVEGAFSGRYTGGRSVHVEEHDDEVVQDADKNVAVHGAYTIRVDDSFRLSRDGTELFVESDISAQSPTRIELVVGGNTITVSDDGSIALSAEQKLELVCGSARLVLTSDGKAQLSADAEATLVTGGSTVKLEPAKITSQSAEVDVIGDSAVTVQGGTVNLN